jgi:hypothetical protein
MSREDVAVCEVMGGFAEDGTCVFRKLYIENADLKCDKPPLMGEHTIRRMTNDESMLSLGIKHRHGYANYPLCVVPLENLKNIKPRYREHIVFRAMDRVNTRLKEREWRANATEEELEKHRAQQRGYFEIMPFDKKKERRTKNKEYKEHLSPEEREEFLAKDREFHRIWYDSLSPEEKEEQLIKGRERNKEWYKSLSPTEREKYNERKRKARKKWIENMPHDRKEEFIAHTRHYMREYYKQRKQKKL